MSGVSFGTGLLALAGPVAQLPAGLAIPEIPWALISPELVLFGTGLLVLVLDTAGEAKRRASLLLFALIAGGAALAAVVTEHTVLPALVGLAAVTQLALTFLWSERPRVLGALLTVLGFAGALGVTIWQWTAYAGVGLVATESVLAGMFAVDGVALFTRFIVCVTGIITIPLGFGYLEERRVHRGEYYPLLLFAATGMTLLAASANLLMIFIAVEILSLSLYILTGFAKRDLNSQESALKYFLLGAFSSAFLLYGIALVYGIAGTTDLAAAASALRGVDAPLGMSLAAMGLLLVGFAFKTALVPFHMWTPDVYQGAPTPITGFMAAGTKAAAFAAFLRVFVGAFGPLQWSWQPAFWALAALTMMVGAILAVVQTDLKRMLGYSAVAHAGYVLIGLMAVSREGVGAALFDLLVYAGMSLGAFGVLASLERTRRKAMALDDLRGLGRRNPITAGLFGLFLLSLAGIPGTAGFMGKLGVFRAGVNAGLTGLVVIAVISSVIAAFFYIRVIVAMFMEDEPAGAPAAPAAVTTAGISAGLAVAAAAVVVLGILPGGLIELAGQAASFAR